MILEVFWTEAIHYFDVQHVTVSLAGATIKFRETDQLETTSKEEGRNKLNQKYAENTSKVQFQQIKFVEKEIYLL